MRKRVPCCHLFPCHSRTCFRRCKLVPAEAGSGNPGFAPGSTWSTAQPQAGDWLCFFKSALLPCHSALDAESRIPAALVGQHPADASNWLCLLAPGIGTLSHNPFQIRRLRQFPCLKNWLCSANTVDIRSFDYAQDAQAQPGRLALFFQIGLRQVPMFRNSTFVPRISGHRLAIGFVFSSPTQTSSVLSFIPLSFPHLLSQV